MMDGRSRAFGAYRPAHHPAEHPNGQRDMIFATKTKQGVGA